MSWAILVALVIAVVGLPLIFNWAKLVNKEEALALPAGSIRAIIALSLIAMFAIVPLVLFTSLSGSQQHYEHLDEAGKDLFVTSYKDSSPIFVLEAADPNAPNTKHYTVHFRERPDPPGVDFAKQLFLMLGTLATSVASFYFGAKVASSASAQGAAQSAAAVATKPVMRSVTAEPEPLERADSATITFKLHIVGTGLNDVKKIKLTSGKEAFVFVSQSNDAQASCDVSCTPKTPPVADWVVTVIDAVGNETTAQPNLVVKF